MSHKCKVKNTISKIFCPLEQNTKQSNNVDTNYNVPHEVFRNDTTAVEIIVKQVKNKKIEPLNSLEGTNVTKLCEDVEHLRNELNKANKDLEDTKKCFKIVLYEMGKQLEAANQRELRRQTRNVVLQLEKEKLKCILESKTNLLEKLRKELLSTRRIIKLVNKGIRSVHYSGSESDSEYFEFVNDLNKDLPKKCDMGAEIVTNETTMSSKM